MKPVPLFCRIERNLSCYGMGDRIDLDLKKFRALLEEERESLLELSSV